MTTWTQMKVSQMVQFSTNLLGTHVTVKTVHGELTESVADLKDKLQNSQLLPAIRKIYQDMLEYAESQK